MKAIYVSGNKAEHTKMEGIFRSNFPQWKLYNSFNTKDALDTIMTYGPFLLVLIDCTNEFVDPIGLMGEINEMTGEKKTFFIGPVNVLQERLDSNVCKSNPNIETFEEPEDLDKMIGAIKKSLKLLVAQDSDIENKLISADFDEYVPLRIKNFYYFTSLPYNIFTRVSADQLVKAIEKNQKFTATTIDNFKRRNIKELFLQKSKQIQFLESSMENISETLKKSSRPEEIIHAQISGVLVLHQFIRAVSASSIAMDFCRDLIAPTKITFERIGHFRNLLAIFPMEHGDMAEQAILVMYVCEAITLELGWDSEMTRLKLGLASLLHDVYLTNEFLSRLTGLEDPEISKFSEDDVNLFKEHPRMAADLATRFIEVSDVDFIISQHHEKPDGEGFPSGLDSKKIQSITCLFIQACEFVLQTVARGLGQEVAQDIIDELEFVHSRGNGKDPYRAFKKLI